MIYIEKEPTPKQIEQNIIQIEKTPGWKEIEDDDAEGIRSYFDQLNKDDIREALLKEQHGLCGYCMRRIKNNNSMIIEHFKPIRHKRDALNYRNWLGCCDGGRGRVEKNQGCLCCDAAKENNEITLCTWDKDVMDRIRYSSDGRIVISPDNEDLRRDINEALHLNGIIDKNGKMKFDTATQLVAGRKATYKNYMNIMKRIDSNNKSRERIQSEVKRIIRKIENSDPYPEYAGGLLYFLKRRLKNDS